MRKRSVASTGELSERIGQMLNSYAVAAGAVCAGVLAATEPAVAQVVYTPAHVVLRGGTWYNLDIDHNGTTDFSFTDAFSALLLYCSTGSGVEEVSGALPLALKRGSRIDSAQVFGCFFGSSFSLMVGVGPDFRYGNFVNVRNRYLGLKFSDNSHERHYGWARFTVHVNPNTFEINALLSGYAYESTPDTPIRAGQMSGTAENPMFAPEPDGSESIPGARSEPQPVSQSIGEAPLGLLALGAQAIPFWRRRDDPIGPQQ